MTEGGEPGWLPDPTGRHELRWFDGARFTDDVSDGGSTSNDLVGGGKPAWPAAPPTAWVAPDQPAEVAPPPRFDTGPRRKRRWVPAALAIGAVVVVAGAASFWWFEIKGPPTGAGTFSGSVDGDAPVAAHRVFVPAGSIALVTVNPSEDLDAVVGFVPDEDDDAEAVEDLMDGTGFRFVAQAVDARDALFGEDDAPDTDELEALGVVGEQVVMLVDGGFEGQPDRTLLVLGDDVAGAIVVAGFVDGDEPSEGSYDLVVEVVDLGIAAADLDDLRGQQALDLAAANDLVPEEFRTLIEETD